MKDAQKPDHISLTTMIGRLKEGRYVIPDFQREFEWGPWDIRDLIRSIFLDYYIGSLLLWKGKAENFKALSCEPVFGHDGTDKQESIVLDGQQRLTAMYYAFLAPDKFLPKRQNRYFYFVKVDHFMQENYDEAFTYEWSSRWANTIGDADTQYESHLFPLAIVGKSGWALANWVQGYERYWQAKAKSAEDNSDQTSHNVACHHVDNAIKFGVHLKEITEQYQIAYIELDKDLEVDKICDIFTQVNSKGIRLDVFDLVNALLKPKGLQLKHMWRAAAPRLEFVQTDRMNVYILQVMSILIQAYCSPKYLYYLLPGQEKKVREADGSLRKEVLVRDITDFKDRWSVAVDALQKAINLIRHPQEFGAISSQYLPYVSILPAFTALQVSSRSLPAARQLDAQRKVRHWYWASVFTNRYSGSVESTSARDYLDVKAWFEADDAKPVLIDEFKARFRAIELRRETKKGGSVYKGIFNLFVIHGARDWVAGTVPQYGDLDDHHIVPKKWGNDHKLGNAIDTILNRSPLTSDTNRNVINDRLPNEYLPELIKQSGESTVRGILETHFISPTAFDILLRKPFGPDDYDAFLTERQRTLQDAIEDLLIKERLDLAPPLRDLDAQLESVELALRRNINEALNGDITKVPSHVSKKIDDRLQTASKKNAALDVNLYQSLNGKLEFADLREIQDTILGGNGWPLFQSRYVNKEALIKRFDQLAELRNGIRHSRTVDEITRKDGEAALLWFRQVLEKVI